MKTTVTEEFDADGKVTKRTTVTEHDAPAPQVSPGSIEVAGCTCGRPWNSIMPPPPCPVHGQGWSPTVWSGARWTGTSTMTTANPAALRVYFGGREVTDLIERRRADEGDDEGSAGAAA